MKERERNQRTARIRVFLPGKSISQEEDDNALGRTPGGRYRPSDGRQPDPAGDGNKTHSTGKRPTR